MLKDLDRYSEDELAPECCANEHNESGGREIGRGCGRFRTSLWLGIAADLRRERLSRAMKGQMSC
jgi:hypothetical protein